MKKKGFVFVVSAPSGTGKTTVIKQFLRRNKSKFKLSISVTTREPRKGEKNGKDYYFFTKEKFRKYIKQGKFLEYARVLDNYYGTLKGTVLKSIRKGKNVIMDIDVQGARKIKKKIKDCITVFIIPPTFAELEKRLRRRKTDSKKSISKRLALARKELRERGRYDYVVINKELGKAKRFIECVYKLEQFKKYKI